MTDGEDDQVTAGACAAELSQTVARQPQQEQQQFSVADGHCGTWSSAKDGSSGWVSF